MKKNLDITKLRSSEQILPQVPMTGIHYLESRIQDILGFPYMGRVISNVSLAFSIQSQELDNL